MLGVKQEYKDSKEWAISFLNRITALKRLKRTGWIVRGIPDPESIASHCYRVSLMTMILGDQAINSGRNLNMEKLLRISLVHEIGEACIGDLHHEARFYIGDAASEGEKKAVEDLIEGSPQSEIYKEAWLDFEERRNPEGKFIRGIDKLEMILTAYEYECAGIRGISEFFDASNTRDIMADPLLKEVYERIVSMRDV